MGIFRGLCFERMGQRSIHQDGWPPLYPRAASPSLPVKVAVNGERIENDGVLTRSLLGRQEGRIFPPAGGAGRTPPWAPNRRGRFSRSIASAAPGKLTERVIPSPPKSMPMEVIPC